MNNDPANAESPLDEQLVAYLDGELNPEGRTRIEALLASDPEVRRRLQSLEQTWDMLDELDAAPVNDRFTRTTLEMVAVAAGEDVEKDRAEAPRRRRRRLLAAGGFLLAFAVFGFLAVALGYNPNRELLEDLPVLENLDEYLQTESIEYLRLLQKENLFPEKNSDSTRDVEAKAGGPAERIRLVESMSPNDKEELARSQDLFVHLDGEKQKKLRQFQRDLQEASDSEQLRGIMDRYCEWLKTLPSFSRVELAGLQPPAARVAWVERRLKEESEREGGRRLVGKDAEILRKWLDDFATRHEDQLFKMLPPQRQKGLPAWGDQFRHKAAFGQMMQTWQASSSVKPPLMKDEDLIRLREQLKLSPEALKSLEGKSIPQQWQQVAFWIHQGMRHAAMTRGFRGSLPKADDEQLANFFENELDKQERERLLGLSGEEMQRELLHLFLTRTKPQGEPRHRPEGPHRD
jgi:hypothetical protein